MKYIVHAYYLLSYLLFLVCRFDNYSRYVDPHIISAEIIQGWKLFKGGNHKSLGGFDCGKLFKGGNYSRAETIRGNTVSRAILTEGVPSVLLVKKYIAKCGKAFLDEINSIQTNH